MILKDITENVVQFPTSEFKVQQGGFPKVQKIQSASVSRFKRSKDDIKQELLDFAQNDSYQGNESKQLKKVHPRTDGIKHAVQKDQSGKTDLKFLLSGELSHGDVEEDKSLQELLDYTRSSSGQIRRRAWGIILKIFKKLGLADECVQVEKEIEKVDLGLYLRVGLDQKELDEILEVLEVFMDLKPDFDEWQGLSRNFMVKIGMSDQLLENNKRKTIGLNLKKSQKVKEKTFGELKSLLKQEPMMGLIEGDVMERLQYLLNTDLEIWNVGRILKLILGFSKYSRKCCAEIVEKGILKTILKFSRKEETRIFVFQIYLNVIAASKNNAVEFIKINGLDVVMASIADLQDKYSNLCWMILSYCCRYGLARGILSDYRPMFYAKAREYLAFSNNEFHLRSRIGLLKCLKDFVCMVPKGFIMGASDDEMKPFLDILLSTFSWIMDVNRFQASISSALDFFSTYVSRLGSSASTLDLCKRIYLHVQVLYPLLKKKALELALLPNSFVDETPPKFWQKMPSNLYEMIRKFNDQTFGIDFFTSILDLMAVINPWINETLDMNTEIQTISNQIMEQPQLYWTRFYTQAQTSLITSHLKVADQVLDKNKKIKIYFYLLQSYQPGQEILCSRTLFALFKLLDTSPLNHISSISNEQAMIMMDIFDKSFYSDANLKNSSAIHNSDYESISSLWMEVEEVEPTLPLSKFWIYSPIDSFIEEEQNQVTICTEDLSGYIFVMYSLVSLCETCGFGLDVGRLIIATMKVCLLSSLSDEAICLEPKIQKCIEYALNTWNSSEAINLEPLMGSEVNFYQLYSQLLSNFSASSFGNELWGRLLLIPLHKMYPCDYKSLFFTSLEPKILSLITAPVGCDFNDYIISKADHEKLNVFDKLIAGKWIKKDINPFLYCILTAEH